MKQFAFKIKWYNESISEESTDYGIVLAHSFSEAAGKITKEFDGTDIIAMNLDDVCSENDELIFLNEKKYEEFIQNGCLDEEFE